MSSVVCTLFEGQYHYGVAGLVNSLYEHGFREDIYVGYRGELPDWASLAYINQDEPNIDCKTLTLKDDFRIHYIKLTTHYHFTNYKSQFIIDLWNGPAKGADNIFYFDPDIINICPWAFYEIWVQFGVTLIHEIASSDMPPNHPKRRIWQQASDAMGVSVKNQLRSYINAGFVGVAKKEIAFVELWNSFIEFSAKHLGLNPAVFCQENATNFSLFTVADQELLNLTAMCTDVSISEMGPEAMGFAGGGWTMVHATGSGKPWKKNFFSSALKGVMPSLADKAYWMHTDGIIKPFSKIHVRYKKAFLKLAVVIGRFYRKS